MLANYTKRTLANGLRVITVPMETASVTILILVGAGSRYETANQNGLSHFLEHMAFKGTKKRPSTLEIASTIEGIGGVFNAFTSKDHTGYWIKAAAKHLPLMIDILSDMFLNSLFKEEEIEREKGVIIEEINMYEDTPIRKIGEEYERLLYGETPLGRDIAGEKEVIKSLKREDFINYLDRHYSPENAVLVVAGGTGKSSGTDFLSFVKGSPKEKVFKISGQGRGVEVWKNEKTHQLVAHPTETSKSLFSKNLWGTNSLRFRNGSLRTLVEKHLGSWPKKKIPFFPKISERQSTPKVRVLSKKTEQVHLCLGVRAIPLTDPRKFALGLLTTILGGGMSSRLFTEVRERRGLAYYIRSETNKYQDVGNFVTQAGIDVNKIEETVKVILEQYHDITILPASPAGRRYYDILEKELKRAKEFVKGNLILSLEDSRAVAGLYAGAELLEGKIRTPKEIIKEIDKVTVEEIISLAREIFVEKNLNLAVIGPIKKGLDERLKSLLRL